MIISSEHHDLLEKFKEAHELTTKITQKLANYVSQPNPDRKIADEFMQKMTDAHSIEMQHWNELQKVKLG